MPEINLFNGGINSHKDPHKLEPNECVNITNADVSSGSIVSVQQPITKYLGIGSVVTDFNRNLHFDDGPYLNFAEQQGRLFKVDGDMPTYTIGDVDANGETIWVPMGIPAPDEIMTAELIVNVDVVYTVLDPVTNPGVLQGSTDYVYILIIDGVPHQSIFTSAHDEVCTALQIDTSAVVGTNVHVYRKVDNHLYRVNVESARVFNDFVKDISDVPTGTDRRTVTMLDLINGGVGIVWDGDGTGRLQAVAAGGVENGVINLDFINGIISGDDQTISQRDISGSFNPIGIVAFPIFSLI